MTERVLSTARHQGKGCTVAKAFVTSDGRRMVRIPRPAPIAPGGTPGTAKHDRSAAYSYDVPLDDNRELADAGLFISCNCGLDFLFNLSMMRRAVEQGERTLWLAPLILPSTHAPRSERP